MSSPLSTGSKPHLLYKCLLDQLAQKLKIEAPRYVTQNEGFDHVPMFRTTVTFDGVSYTSSSTFQHLKTSQMDACRIAYIATTQKAMTEALSSIRVDKTSCKSILVDFAAKKDLKYPIYETTCLESVVPIFRSNLIFDGVTYPGDIGKSKKEAEQLVARSVIMKYLGTEAGFDMAMVVNYKLRQFQEISKALEIKIAQTTSSHDLGPQMSSTLESSLGEDTTIPAMFPSAGVPQPIPPQLPVEPIIPVAPESSLGEDTMIPATFPSAGVPQPIPPQMPVEPIIPVAPVVIQSPVQQVSPTVPVVTEPSISQAAVELKATPLVEIPAADLSKPLGLTPIPPAVVNNLCTSVLPAALVEIPATDLSKPLGLTPIPSAVVNNPCIPAPVVEISATDLSSNVIQQLKAEESPAEALEYKPLVSETSKKKRNRKDRRNARKKMRADAQMPVVPAS